MSPVLCFLSFQLLAMSAPSPNQDVPFRPLHELLAEMNITDASSNTVTWTCRTTEESVTISRVPPASGTAAGGPSLNILSSSHSPTITQAPTERVASITATRQQKPNRTAKSSAKATSTHNPPIPHPSRILPPTSNTSVQGYYVITVGQEVGIFYNWPDVAARTNNISGNTHKQCKSFSKALKVYTRMYHKGCVRAVPVPGGPFWPEAEQSDSSTSRSSSPTSSTELWSQLGELPIEALANIP
ncbi:hypothetical protein BKA83DRAFT_4506112 [Pisolithus microcarpus]|nr:hypothetical protein BKA83DRAFT_4506112 [Pisolithus microcarpus]